MPTQVNRILFTVEIAIVNHTYKGSYEAAGANGSCCGYSGDKSYFQIWKYQSDRSGQRLQILSAGPEFGHQTLGAMLRSRKPRDVVGSTPRENEGKRSEHRASRVHNLAHGFEGFEMVE